MTPSFNNIPLNLAVDTILIGFSGVSNQQIRDLQSGLNTLTDHERLEYNKYLKILESKRGTLEYYWDKGWHEGFKEGYESTFQQSVLKGRKEGIEEGRKEGIEEGRSEALIETAIKLKYLGLPFDQISAVTHIDIKAIESL